MAEAPNQNFKNHTKFVPAYHFVALPILVLNFVWTLKVADQRSVAWVDRCIFWSRSR